MIVDTSAVVAILRNESEAFDFVDCLKNVGQSYMAAPNYVELCIVMLGNKSANALRKTRSTLEELGIEIIPFTADMAEIAATAFEYYGKGRGHRAQLNFGDCLAYATSKAEAKPLLFKGDDFRLTDVECAL